MPRRTIPLVLAGAAGLALSTGACGAAQGGDPERVDVVAAFYPLQFVAERVGGDAAVVHNLTKPGAEPHDLELTPVQVAQITDAELVVHLAGFQPAVDEAVEQQAADRALDAASAVTLLPADAGIHAHDGGGAAAADGDGTGDPHLWLDPARLAGVGDAVADRLAAVDPDRAADFRARAATLRTDLETLDREYEDGLKQCQRREFIVSHVAFSYLADRYHLEQIAISGLSPEEEPSPRRLAEVADEARRHGATTIFFETLISPKLADTIAREVGADTAVLDPLEGLPPGSPDDYFSVMRKNLGALRAALDCP